jgi:hypothetical protein
LTTYTPGIRHTTPPSRAFVDACGLIVAFGAIAGGVVLVTAGNNLARSGDSEWSAPLFWSGLALLFVVPSMRLLGTSASSAERVALVALIGLGLYVVKLSAYPSLYVFHDELGQWRSTADILETGHLFGTNPIARYYPLYPGLAALTAVVSATSGLSIHMSGLIIIAAARLLMSLALFRVFHRFSGSARVAGLASALYAANPNFSFFDSQFGYESLALPLAVIVLLATDLGVSRGRSTQRPLKVATLVLLAGLIVTHHATVFIFGAMLLVWGFASLRRGRSSEGRWPSAVGAAALAGGVLWLAIIARETVDILLPIFRDAFSSLRDVIGGSSGAKQVFHNGAGETAPRWAQILSVGAVLTALAGLAGGARGTGRAARRHPGALMLVLLALTYPFTLALRLTSSGTETSNRAAEFVYLGLALALAFACLALVGRSSSGFQRVLRSRAGIAVLLGVLLAGNLVIGFSPALIQPTSFRVASDIRGADSFGEGAATWARLHLPHNRNVVSDRMTDQILGAYGLLSPKLGSTDHLPVASILVSTKISPQVILTMRYDKIAYVVFDRRATDQLPDRGVYVDGLEAGAGNHRVPLRDAALNKFRDSPLVSEVYNNGKIDIFDVRALWQS